MKGRARALLTCVVGARENVVREDRRARCGAFPQTGARLLGRAARKAPELRNVNALPAVHAALLNAPVRLLWRARWVIQHLCCKLQASGQLP